MEGSGAVTAAPSWANPQDVRRLNAYFVLSGYYENAARVFLDDDDEDKKNSWREYGDPWTIVQRISAGILGSNPNIGIAGADVALPLDL